MILSDLIDEVKSRFVILLHNEPEKLTRLAMSAIRTYQDKVGFVERRTGNMDTTSNQIQVSEFAIAVVSCTDATGQHYDVDDLSNGQAVVDVNKWCKRPLSITYLVDKAEQIELNPDTQEVPRQAIVAIEDLLYTLIAIPNTQRLRAINETSELPTDGLLSEAELIENRNRLIEKLEQNAVLMPAMVL